MVTQKKSKNGEETKCSRGEEGKKKEEARRREGKRREGEEKEREEKRREEKREAKKREETERGFVSTNDRRKNSPFVHLA